MNANKVRTVISLSNLAKSLSHWGMDSALKQPVGFRLLGILKMNGLAIPLVVDEEPTTHLHILRDQFNESVSVRDFSGWVPDDAKR